MRKFKLNFALFSFILAFLSFAASNAETQLDGPKAKEKILQIKKMKLMEILNLDEATADKFIVRYTAIEKKLDEKKTNLDREVDELHEMLKKGKSDAEMVAKTNRVIQMQNDFANDALESMKSLKPLLNDFEYAKYVVFESKFRQEFQKILFQRLKEKGNFKNKRNMDD